MPMESKHSESDDLNFDFDSILNLEDQYYQEGFNEGQLEGARKQFHEGKELGIQTGFQRLLIIGQFRVLINTWIGKVDKIIQVEKKQDLPIDTTTAKEEDDSKKRPKREYTKIMKTLLDLKMILDALFENDKLVLTNSDSDVIKYDTILKKLRFKIRSLSSTLNDEELYKSIESLSQSVGGVIPQASITGTDQDIW